MSSPHVHQREGEVPPAAALHRLVDPDHGERLQQARVFQRAGINWLETELTDDGGITRTRIVDELGAIAFSDIKDFVDWSADTERVAADLGVEPDGDQPADEVRVLTNRVVRQGLSRTASFWNPTRPFRPVGGCAFRPIICMSSEAQSRSAAPVRSAGHVKKPDLLSMRPVEHADRLGGGLQ